MLGRLQRIWLETFLAASDGTPTILFCHHAPRADFLDTGRLFEIISPVRKVKALVFGHSHRYEFSERDGIHLINLPATVTTSPLPSRWLGRGPVDKRGRRIHAPRRRRQHEPARQHAIRPLASVMACHPPHREP